MKTLRLVCSLLALMGLRLFAQDASSSAPSSTSQTATAPPPDKPFAAVWRDAQHTIWQSISYESTPGGQWFPHIHQYVETATGLNFLDQDTGQFEPSSEQVEQYAGGAVARHGQTKVIFANDLAAADAVDIQMPDGQELHTRLAGLSYFDTASGQSVLIAEIASCTGEIVGSNQVWYESAFSGVKAGVRYTYTLDGFEQDIILEERPAVPEAYGLSSASTVLQALTEFISPPQPVVSTENVVVAPGVQMPDQTLDFGAALRISRGQAFLMGDNSQSVPVTKEWLNLDGRQFLVEEVPVAQIAGQLDALPAGPSVSLKAAPGSVLNAVSSKRLLPARRMAERSTQPMKLASLPARKPGYLIDYTTLNTTQTNQVFQGDTTYFLSGNVNLYGTNTVFEGGSVLKFSSNVTLTVHTPVSWRSKSYLPVDMLAKDDDATGQAISGSTGNPGTKYYANVALNFDGVSALTNLTLDNVCILNAAVGIAINGQSGHVLSDVQMVDCGSGIAATNTDFSLRNALFYVVRTNFSGSSATGRVEQLTSDTAAWLNQNIGTNLFLTNCLLAAVTNLGNWGTNSFVAQVTNSAVFQTALPGGYHYLPTNSPFHGAGTTNISPATMALLQQRTTYPPIVYTNTTFWTNTSFSPQATRDTNGTDLGYHYYPVDYVFGGVISNANLTFMAGTAVGWYRTTSGWRGYGGPIVGDGINMANSAIADFQGTATAPCYFVRCNTVQEQDNSGGYGPGGITGSDDQYAGNISISPVLLMNFTKCISMADDGGCQFRDDWGYLVVQANNSELYNGNCGGYVISCYFTNCLWDRQEGGQVEGHPGDEWIMRNCTFHGGELYMGRDETAIPVSVRDCSFDSTAFSLVDSYSSNHSYTDYNYNAYTNTSNPFPLSSTNDVIMTNGFPWESSWFGNYYLSSNSPLINAGDVTANLVGLYHFTTQTNQTIEGDSQVDFGYHYVATDSNGNPLDTNGDGIPDYLEDANGDGIFDAGDAADWQISPFGLGNGNTFQVFTPLK